MKMKSKLSFTQIFMMVMLLLIYAPIVILIIYSFNSSNYSNMWGGFSFKWYASIFTDEDLINALTTSLRIATSSATLAAILGTMAGIILSKFGSFFGRNLYIGLLSAPFTIPEVVTGFSMLLIFIMIERAFGLSYDRGSLAVILAHTTIGMSYVAITVYARLDSFDDSLEEAAMDLGAHPLKIFFVITLPIIAKSLIAGWLLTFTLSLDDVVVASFTSGAGTTTLPMLIYSRVKFGLSPQINALASIMIATVVVGISVVYLVSGSTFNKKEKE